MHGKTFFSPKSQLLALSKIYSCFFHNSERPFQNGQKDLNISPWVAPFLIVQKHGNTLFLITQKCRATAFLGTQDVEFINFATPYLWVYKNGATLCFWVTTITRISLFFWQLSSVQFRLGRLGNWSKPPKIDQLSPKKHWMPPKLV